MFASLAMKTAERERSYDVWRLAQAAAADALHAWLAGSRDVRASRFRAYRAALDREEQAALKLPEIVH